MASLADLRAKFESLLGNESNFVAQAIDEKGEEAVNYNALQLAQGLKSDGTPANFSYTPFTIASKRGKPGLSGVTDHLTNFDTGKSFQLLFEKVKGNIITFGTSSGLQDKIDQRMDGLAFGLDPDNKEEFLKSDVAPLFVEKIKQFVGL